MPHRYRHALSTRTIVTNAGPKRWTVQRVGDRSMSKQRQVSMILGLILGFGLCGVADAQTPDCTLGPTGELLFVPRGTTSIVFSYKAPTIQPMLANHFF